MGTSHNGRVRRGGRCPHWTRSSTVRRCIDARVRRRCWRQSDLPTNAADDGAVKLDVSQVRVGPKAVKLPSLFHRSFGLSYSTGTDGLAAWN